jgi:hypothetical protein
VDRLEEIPPAQLVERLRALFPELSGQVEEGTPRGTEQPC